MRSIQILCIRYIINSILLLFSEGILSQGLPHENYVSIDEDFTPRAVTSIFKDKEGYLWIGTYGDGIFKYNSTDFKNYKQDLNSKENSLNSSIIFSTLQDAQNNIWVGTQHGINLYNYDLDRFENIDLSGNQKFETFEIHAINEYSTELLLFGTHEHGLIKFNKNDYSYSTITYKNKDSLANLLINTVVKSANGRYMIGTNFGLMTFDPYNEVLQLAKFDTGNTIDFIDNSIESALVATDESLWVGTSSSGIYRLIENSQGIYTIEHYPISKKRILSFAEKSDSSILCGTENDGLFEIQGKTGSFENIRYNKLKQNGIKSNSIWTIFADTENRVWLGYYNSGIDVYDPNYNKFNAIESIPYLANSLNSNSVTGVAKDKKGRFWIGLLDGGVDVYNPQKGTFVNLNNQNNSIASGFDGLDVQTVFIDRNNNVWIGTWDSGLFLLKDNQKKFINISTSTNSSVFKYNRIMTFDEDAEGTIWIGTFSNGLYSFNPITNSFTHHNTSEFNKFNISAKNIRKVLVDGSDNIWLGTRSGLFKVEKTNDSSYAVTTINDKMNLGKEQPVKASIIASIFEDKSGYLWIGTYGNGLCRFDVHAGSVNWFNLNNGLIHETVYSIEQDNSGDLWIGGNAGLTKLSDNQRTFTNFNKKDGLLSNNFSFNSVYRSPNNVLYFGNSKGINFFNPDEIVYNQKKPIVYITDLKISNDLVKPNTLDSPLKKVISRSTDISLSHKQSIFTIDYVGINYTRSENNQYAYYLEGYENEWNYVGSSQSATYKNIPRGDYIFKVKASNNDGIWNETPTILKIEIRAAWWRTNLAITLYFLLILIISYSIFKFVNIRIKERRILNMERREHKQFEALNAKKIQFFTNISHEFRTPLTLILSPLEEILETAGQQFSKEVKEKHRIIHKNAKRLSRLINELMDFRKLQFNKMSINASQIDVVPFIEEVASHFEEEAMIKNIVLSVAYDEHDITIWSDPTMLEKIVFNLLSNAFKATTDGGLVAININRPKEFILLPLVDEKEPVPAIEIIIKDTGLGIKEENIEKIFDRFYQAKEMDGQYYGGTGIGLELVKSLIDLHKGKIVLTSKEKEGTIFKIYFPLGYSHLKDGELVKPTKYNVSQQKEIQINELESDELVNDSNSESKKMVLVIEDNVELRTYLKNELNNEYTVKEAENGQEGLEKAIKYIPDIIITDVMMPIMDGFELCSRIKSDLKTSHIPLLMVTAKGMQIDKVKGIDSGADVYLNKPFNMKVLRSHLKQLINSRQVLFDKYFNAVNTVIDSDNTTSLDKQFITDVINYIQENLSDEKLNVEQLAAKLFLSRSKLYRKIKALTGDTAIEFIKKIRLEKAHQLIETSQFTISEICFTVGFSSPSYFTKCFKNHFGIIPTDLQRKVSSNKNS